MPLGFSDLLVVLTLRTEITLCPCGEEERHVNNDYKPLRKCIINYYTINCPLVEVATLDSNASVTKHSYPRDKGDGRKRDTHFNKKVQSLPPFPMLLKKMIAQTQRSPKS